VELAVFTRRKDVLCSWSRDVEAAWRAGGNDEPPNGTRSPDDSADLVSWMATTSVCRFTPAAVLLVEQRRPDERPVCVDLASQGAA
jgi:hypothetical protein